MEQLEQALQGFAAAKDQEGSATTSELLAIAALQAGEYTTAEHRYLEALKALEGLQDRAGQIEILRQLGLVYQMLGREQAARSRYHRADELASE